MYSSCSRQNRCSSKPDSDEASRDQDINEDPFAKQETKVNIYCSDSTPEHDKTFETLKKDPVSLLTDSETKEKYDSFIFKRERHCRCNVSFHGVQSRNTPKCSTVSATHYVKDADNSSNDEEVSALTEKADFRRFELVDHTKRTDDEQIVKLLPIGIEGTFYPILCLSPRDLLVKYGISTSVLQPTRSECDQDVTNYTAEIGQNAIFLHTDGIRCMVTKKHILSFDLETQSEANNLLFSLIQYLQNLKPSNPVPSSNLYTASSSSAPPPKPDQEPRVQQYWKVFLQSILATVLATLQGSLSTIKSTGSEYLSALSQDGLGLEVKRLRKMMEDCEELKYKSKRVREMLEKMMRNTEKLVQFESSSCRCNKRETGNDKQKENEEDVGGVEENIIDMVKHYSEHLHGVESHADFWLARADRMTATVNMCASKRSTKLNSLVMFLTILTTSCTAGSLLAAVFGMNLVSGLENTSLGFVSIASIIAAIVVSSFLFLMWYAMKNRIIN